MRFFEAPECATLRCNWQYNLLSKYFDTNEAYGPADLDAHGSNVGLWEADFVIGELKWNEVTRRIHGVGPDFKPNLASAINFIPDGPRRDEMGRLFEEAKRTGDIVQQEFPIVKENGELVWVRSIAKPILIDGECTQIFGLIQGHIDQIVQPSGTPALRDKWFESFFDNSSSGHVVFDLD